MDEQERDRRIQEMANVNALQIPSSGIQISTKYVGTLARDATNLYRRKEYLQADAKLALAQQQLAKISRQVDLMRSHIAKTS